MIAPKKLSDYPWVVVRVECKLCPRKGRYRLARLAARYGPEMPLERLLAALSGDCPYWRRPERIRKYTAHCGAQFIDLDHTLPPPDVPREVAHRQRQLGREDVPQQRPATRNQAGDVVPMLSGWPLPTLTIICRRCGRRDEHQVARLLLDGDVKLGLLLKGLTQDCPSWQAQSIYELCGARFDMPWL